MNDKSKHIKQYSLPDIEKYLEGKLSPAEMHELEKAALQDPFLADAIEGYQSADLSAAKENLTAINTLLANGPATIIPLVAKRNLWWQVAAAVILLAGAGILGSILFTAKDNQQAITKQERLAQIKKDSMQPLTAVADKKDTVALINKEPILSNHIQHNLKSAKTAVGHINSYDSATRKSLAMLAPVSTIATGKDLLADTVLFDKSLANSFTVRSADARKQVEIKVQNTMAKIDNRYLNKTWSGTRNLLTAKEITAVQTVLPATVKIQKNRKDTLLITAEDMAEFSASNLKASDTALHTLSNLTPFGYSYVKIPNTKTSFRTINTTPLANLKKQGVNITFSVDSSGLSANKLPAALLQDAMLAEVVVTGYSKNTKKDLMVSLSGNAKKEETIVDPVGGWKNFTAHLINKITKAGGIKKEPGQYGSLQVEMDIAANGKVTNIKIVHSFDAHFNRALIRAIKNGPSWKTADQENKMHYIFTVTL